MSNHKNNTPIQVKIFFKLAQDEDGYPPVSTESLWATKTLDNLYEIDNIPFYAQEISYKDVVDINTDTNGNLYFKNVIRRSGHSTIRVILSELKEKHNLLKKLEELGCAWEGSHQPSLIALDIPPSVNTASVLRLLQDGFEQEKWDFEEACIAI